MHTPKAAVVAGERYTLILSLKENNYFNWDTALHKNSIKQ